MDLKKGYIALINGIEFVIEDIIGINYTNALWDIRIGIKKGNITGSEEIEKALLSGIEPEDAIVSWFYNQKVKTFGNYDSIKNPNIEASTKEVYKMIHIDELSMIEIIDALNFSLTDNFWKNQILSLSGLRKKNKSGVRKMENLRLASKRNKEEKLQDTKKPVSQQSKQYKDLD